MSRMEAYLGLGCNEGDCEHTLRSALRALSATLGIDSLRSSSVYRTPPWGVIDQADFLNLVAACETSLSPKALLQVCREIERSHGRRRVVKWGPRPLDIDILIMGSLRIVEGDLAIPHPRMLQRGFVLVPLAELAPRLQLEGKLIAEWIAGLDTSGIVRVGRPLLETE